jgi:hypothetical protein
MHDPDLDIATLSKKMHKAKQFSRLSLTFPASLVMVLNSTRAIEKFLWPFECNPRDICHLRWHNGNHGEVFLMVGMPNGAANGKWFFISHRPFFTISEYGGVLEARLYINLGGEICQDYPMMEPGPFAVAH